MADLKKQIFQELSALEDATARLCGIANNAGKQTDLEIAVLKKQLESQRNKNAQATELIDKSMSILKNLI